LIGGRNVYEGKGVFNLWLNKMPSLTGLGFLIFSGFSLPSHADQPQKCSGADHPVVGECGVSADAEYRNIVRRELEFRNSDRAMERIASGSAALAIGTYGYFFDDRGISGKAIYSATQTAGVLLLSNGIFDANHPSLVLSMNSHIQRHGQLRFEDFRSIVVDTERQRLAAENKQLAYTSMILAGLYGYNGYRTKSDEFGVRNTLYFLSFNFAIVSAVNFYRLGSRSSVAQVAADKGKLRLTLFPEPTLVYSW
jgi:hypothetical protein